MGDEKQARHVLADMQARLARSAYDALNIPAGDVAPEQVRAAFLELTKTYHPAKFARMAPELYKLANEVFLGLRAAYDQLSRPRSSPVRQSGPMPSFVPSKTPGQGTGAIPVMRPPATAPRANVPPAPSPALTPATQRGVPPAPTSSITPSTQRGAPLPPAPQRPGTAPQPPLQRPGTPPIARPGTQPATQQIRRMTPAGGVPAVARPTAQPTPASGTPSAKGAEPELAGVYDQLSKGQWEQARQTLNALIALQPRPRYRALLQYSVGREAQLARRLDEARVELQGALEIDPDLQLAKTALAELFTRRK